VLPFANLSGDPEQEYFSDGITEDIITDLSKISSLFVLARNATLAHRGRALEVQGLCRRLGVRHLVEGSVRKAGNRVRITAQLIGGKTGGHLWADRLDRSADSQAAAEEALARAGRELERALAIEPDDLATLYNVACAYAQLGDVEDAVGLLERVQAPANERARSWFRAWSAQGSHPDPLRGHPRLAALMRRLAETGWAPGHRRCG
jgi:TolB-like protein